ncbi:hypothetical protein ACWFMI_23685 [Nocardiopsis terrae]|uniref:hypothetical protein n=1 Tax=Streptomyces sp. NPDC057554 TaxID=3350538 RepID=UPI003678D10E
MAATKAVGSPLIPFQVTPGDRLAVTLKNGTRRFLTAQGVMKDSRGGFGWTIAATNSDGHWEAIESDTADTLFFLG